MFGAFRRLRSYLFLLEGLATRHPVLRHQPRHHKQTQHISFFQVHLVTHESLYPRIDDACGHPRFNVPVRLLTRPTSQPLPLFRIYSHTTPEVVPYKEASSLAMRCGTSLRIFYLQECLQLAVRGSLQRCGVQQCRRPTFYRPANDLAPLLRQQLSARVSGA